MLTTGKLGFWGLTALVFGLMVGVGIYNLPQNMAAVTISGVSVYVVDYHCGRNIASRDGFQMAQR